MYSSGVFCRRHHQQEHSYMFSLFTLALQVAYKPNEHLERCTNGPADRSSELGLLRGVLKTRSSASIDLQKSHSTQFGATTCMLRGVPKYRLLSPIISSHSCLSRSSQLPIALPFISFPYSRSSCSNFPFRYYIGRVIKERETRRVANAFPSVRGWNGEVPLGK